MGMLKWLAIGMVAVAFAAVSLLGKVPELADRQQQASAVESIRAAYAHDEVEAARDIDRAVRACLKWRSGSRMPSTVAAFVRQSIIVLASDANSRDADYSGRFRQKVEKQAIAMQDTMAALDARERAHVQSVLSDFSANPGELMGCVAANISGTGKG